MSNGLGVGGDLIVLLVAHVDVFALEASKDLLDELELGLFRSMLDQDLQTRA
jgi:hypothetical protein